MKKLAEMERIRATVDEAQLVRTSKFLSKHLRHQPARVGPVLAPGGWVCVEALLAGCAAHHLPLTRAELDEVVERNDKQRFSYDKTGRRIRANQGHSVAVDLQLKPVEPPAQLFHGTGAGTVAAIRREGLRKMRRHHVLLSSDVATALAVGTRHGQPIVLAVDAMAMRVANIPFYQSENGVWLVESVPPVYLSIIPRA